MNTVLEKYKWIRYAVGTFIIALGILIIVLACLNMGALANVINIIVASSLIVLGLISLIITIFSETHKGFTSSLVISSAIIAAGILLLVARFGSGFTIDNKLLVYILSIFILVFGVASLFKGVSLIVYKEKRTLIFLLFLVAIVAIVMGILGIVFTPKLVVASYIILGIVVLAAGILLIVYSVVNDKKKSA
jgi:uncharacterized membrane protein HdeD (DUF308 family)